MRFPAVFLFCLGLLGLGFSGMGFSGLGFSGMALAGPTCTPAQDRAAAKATALQAAEGQLNLLALSYQWRGYTKTGYRVNITRVNLLAKSGTAHGTLNVWANEPGSTRQVTATYRGAVTLKRLPGCQWKATGYKQQ